MRPSILWSMPESYLRTQRLQSVGALHYGQRFVGYPLESHNKLFVSLEDTGLKVLKELPVKPSHHRVGNIPFHDKTQVDV